MSAFNNAEWPDETVAQLRLLWDEGHTTAEIGRRLGVSKNAVCGKARRLNLAPRMSPMTGTILPRVIATPPVPKPTPPTAGAIPTGRLCQCGTPLTRRQRFSCSRACGGRISSSTQKKYSEDQDNALRALWDAGHSQGEIGRRLDISKHVVSGRVRRLGLKARPSPIIRTDKPAPAPRVPCGAATLPALSSAGLTLRQIGAFGHRPPKPPEVTVEQLRLALSVATVTRATRCQFPMWQHGERPPRDVAKRFCNAPSRGSYCAEHHRQCYIKKADLRWAA